LFEHCPHGNNIVRRPTEVALQLEVAEAQPLLAAGGDPKAAAVILRVTNRSGRNADS
jgi:hypothetical protein